MHVHTSRMKAYRLSLERNSCNSGFSKLALCVLEVDDKSSFLMSGHAGPLKALIYLRIRPTSSSKVLEFNATDSARNTLLYVWYVCSIHFYMYFP